MILLEYPNIKIFLQNVKNTVPRTYFISDLKGEEIVGMFYEKELKKKKKRKKKNQKEFIIEKVIKRKDDKYMLNGKAMI